MGCWWYNNFNIIGHNKSAKMWLEKKKVLRKSFSLLLFLLTILFFLKYFFQQNELQMNNDQMQWSFICKIYGKYHYQLKWSDIHHKLIILNNRMIKKKKKTLLLTIYHLFLKVKLLIYLTNCQYIKQQKNIKTILTGKNRNTVNTGRCQLSCIWIVFFFPAG